MTVLQARGLKTVILAGRRGHGDYTLPEGLEVATIRGLDGKIPLSPLVFGSLFTLIKRHRPDAVLARDIFTACYAVPVAIILRIPCYVDVADNYPEVVLSIPGLRVRGLLCKALNLAEHMVLRHSTAAVFVTTESQRHVMSKHRLNHNNCFIAHNAPIGSPDQHARSCRKYMAPSHRIVYIGTIDAGIRDIETVVRGLGIYNAGTEVAVSLVIYAFEPKVAQGIVDQAGATGHVIIQPAIPNEDMKSVLMEFDAGVVPHCRCPATEYTAPNKIFDYWYAGIPVISSDNPPLKRLVGEVGGGVIYSSGDPESFAQALGQLYRSMVHTDPLSALKAGYEWNVQTAPFLDRIQAGFASQRMLHR